MANITQLKKLILTARKDVLQTKETFSLNDIAGWINKNSNLCVTRQQVRNALITILDESRKNDPCESA